MAHSAVGEPPHVRALGAKIGVLQRFGYRWLDTGSRGEVTTLHLELKMPPGTYENVLDAVQACWDHFTANNDVWLRTDDASMFLKLHDARTGNTSAAVVVMEHIWPFDRSVFIFNDMKDFVRLADLRFE